MDAAAFATLELAGATIDPFATLELAGATIDRLNNEKIKFMARIASLEQQNNDCERDLEETDDEIRKLHRLSKLALAQLAKNENTRGNTRGIHGGIHGSIHGGIHGGSRACESFRCGACTASGTLCQCLVSTPGGKCWHHRSY